MEIDEYKKKWDNLDRIEIKMIKQIGKCNHAIGDTFFYENPYKKPRNVCNALLHVLDLYTWRISLDFPSWESDNSKIYRIHCPSKNGTVWEMKKVI